MTDTTPVTFTEDELWVLQRVVRHEAQGMREWVWPIASVELNDAIAEALLMCHEDKVSEATLVLSRGDCLLIDAVVPRDAKGPSGQMVGVLILLKTYAARRSIAGRVEATAEEPQQLSPAELTERLAAHEELYRPPRRKRKRDAN